MTRLIVLLFWFARLLDRGAGAIYLRWLKIRIYFTEVSRNGKCPACGARQSIASHLVGRKLSRKLDLDNGTILWCAEIELTNGKRGAILHRCKICDANWPERPLMDPESWDMQIVNRPAPEKKSETTAA